MASKGSRRGGGNSPADAPRQLCAICGGEMRFSHREQTRRGAMVVLRCSGCGTTRSHAAAAGDGEDRRAPSRKPPVDEGPPENRVISPEMARLLIDSLGNDDSPPA